MHPFTVWLALAGSIWALFALAHDHLPIAQHAQVTAWLRGQRTGGSRLFLAVCASVFGPPTLARAHLWRLCVALQITAFLALCLSSVLYPGTSGAMILALVFYAPFLISAMAVMNWLPGVSAFLLCGALLQRADKAPRHRGLGVQYGLVILASGGVALLAGALGVLVVSVSSYLGVLRWPVTWLSGYAAFAFTSRAGALSVLGDALRLQPVIVPGLIFPSFGIWLYAPCFPLIWLGLYLLAGQCLRGAAACWCFPHSGSPYGLDIDGKPMQALGAVAVGLVSVLYWTAVLWCR